MTAIEGITYRAARADDLARVEALLGASNLPLDGVADALDDFELAEADGQLAGVAGLEIVGDDALLRSVAVAPEWRGRGVGRALTERLIATAGLRRLRALYLLTTTAADYFPGFGFETITRDEVPASLRETAEFRDACPASATVMRREVRA